MVVEGAKRRGATRNRNCKGGDFSGGGIFSPYSTHAGRPCSPWAPPPFSIPSTRSKALSFIWLNSSSFEVDSPQYAKDQHYEFYSPFYAAQQVSAPTTFSLRSQLVILCSFLTIAISTFLVEGHISNRFDRTIFSFGQ